MIVVIRIAGRCNLKSDVSETLSRLNLKRKYNCIVIDEKDKVKMGMVKKVLNYVMVNKIDEKMIKELKDKRGKDSEVFTLHPPIGGFKKSTKNAYPRGILGENPDTIKYLEKML